MVSKVYFPDYGDMLIRGLPFALSRYGDGEWCCILGRGGHNCDGHHYFPELQRDLIATLLDPKELIFYGWLNCSKDAGMEEIEEFIAEEKIDVQWADGDVLMQRSKDGELLPFIEALRRRRMIYVGPPHLRELRSKGILNWVDFVPIPLKDCYKNKHEIMRVLADSMINHHPDLVLFSAGMLSNVIIYEMYAFVQQGITFMDVGSLFDIYAGVKSRKTYRNEDWGERIRRNLGKTED
jgi:hypothetical protein